MKRLFTAFLIATAAPAALAQVTVRDPWVRATVPQQKATGAFMRITSPQGARLVEASSPIAGAVEFHEMAMQKDVMKMRAVRAIALPAGKTVDLKAGGYHVMLLELKRQVKEGETVPVALVIEGKDGKRETIEVRAPVKPLATPSGGSMKK